MGAFLGCSTVLVALFPAILSCRGFHQISLQKDGEINTNLALSQLLDFHSV